MKQIFSGVVGGIGKSDGPEEADRDPLRDEDTPDRSSVDGCTAENENHEDLEEEVECLCSENESWASLMVTERMGVRGLLWPCYHHRKEVTDILGHTGHEKL